MVSPSDIRTVIKNEDDFGHEMRVGHIIQGIEAIQMQHGGTYTDPVTQKPRQFDYRCSLMKETQCLSLAVECKNLNPSVLLVVCGTKRQHNEAFHDLVESAATPSGPSSVTRRARREDSFYPSGHFVGKSLVRIQADKTRMARTPDSDIYDKWAQALSSAVGLVKPICGFSKGLLAPRFAGFTAVLPLVVVPDEQLWCITYDNTGNISGDPAQANECEFFVGKEIEIGAVQLFSFSHVHFFTLSGFRSFLSKMALNEHAWTRLFTEKALEI